MWRPEKPIMKPASVGWGVLLGGFGFARVWARRDLAQGCDLICIIYGKLAWGYSEKYFSWASLNSELLEKQRKLQESICSFGFLS